MQVACYLDFNSADAESGPLGDPFSSARSFTASKTVPPRTGIKLTKNMGLEKMIQLRQTENAKVPANTTDNLTAGLLIQC